MVDLTGICIDIVKWMYYICERGGHIFRYDEWVITVVWIGLQPVVF